MFVRYVIGKHTLRIFSALYETPLREKLWAFLNAPETILQMETETALDRRAVEGIENPLLQKFGEAILENRGETDDRSHGPADHAEKWLCDCRSQRRKI